MAKSKDSGINPNTSMSIREAQKVREIYQDAYMEMQRQMSKQLSKGYTTDSWQFKKIQELKRLMKELDYVLSQAQRQAGKQVDKSTYQMFADGARQMDNELNDWEPDARIIPRVPSFSIDTRKVEVLANQTKTYLYNKHNIILQSCNIQYVSIVNQVVSQMATGVITRRQAVSKILEQQPPGAKFRDRIGRQWRMDAYADMVVRTGYVQANLAGSTDRMQDYGLDKVIVSSHPGACPLCIPWEGEILTVLR